jgi:hypothetical protein
MSTEIIVAVLSLIGTAVGSLAGILTANKLMMYRIEQLEKKVEKHNNLIERTFKIEEGVAILDEKIRVANHRIDDLESKEA